MDAHQPGKEHAYEDGNERQSVVLFADYFVIQTEDMLPDEAGWLVMSRMRRLVHFPDLERIYLHRLL
jgi:hypothetical protein